MAIGTTNFPTSLDTAVELVEVADNAVTTLSATLLVGDTTASVVSTSLFPTTGILTIENEKLSYTGKTATTFTGLTRGVGGTSAAEHASSRSVECLIVEEWHRVHSAAIIAIETKLGTGATIAVNKLTALTASIVPITDGSGFLSSSAVTPTELGYLTGVTSAIQTQLNAKQSLDATLTALAAYNTNGLLTQTASDTFTGRTITGTTDRISISNGNGVSGNPTIDIASGYVGQASITTLGTITTGVWNGTAIAAAYIGDLSSVYQPLDADLTAIAALSANGLLRKSAGTWAMDSATYLTANQTITLSGDVSGSGTAAITTTIGAGVVTNTMLAGSIAYSKLSLTGAILNADLAGSIAISKLSISGTPDGTKFLRDDGSWAAASGGGGTPGGSNKQVQFNSSSSFGGAAGFEYQSGASPNVLITAQNATYVPLVVKGAASQSANLMEWQDSAGTALLKFTAAARIVGTDLPYDGGTNLIALRRVGEALNILSMGWEGEMIIVQAFSSGDSGSIGYRVHNNTDQDAFMRCTFKSASDKRVILGCSVDTAISFVVNNTEQLRLTSSAMTFADAKNIVVGTSTGTKIGTATGQKLGFWNATPVVQQVLATGASHVVDDVIGLLQTLGLCKQS